MKCYKKWVTLYLFEIASFLDDPGNLGTPSPISQAQGKQESVTKWIKEQDWVLVSSVLSF